jgi:hypothetical protein
LRIRTVARETKYVSPFRNHADLLFGHYGLQIRIDPDYINVLFYLDRRDVLETY